MKFKKFKNIELIKKIPRRTNPILLSKSRKFTKKEIINAKFRAKELIITNAFVNRISKKSKRPIVVVGVKNTGTLYTAGIKTQKNIYLEQLYYPSSSVYIDVSKGKENLKKLIEKYKKQNPIFIFIDSSTSKKMPASLIGDTNITHTSFEESILGLLKKQKMNLKITGYNWSFGKLPFLEETILKNFTEKKRKVQERDFLPNYTTKELQDVNAILFNPSKESTKQIEYKKTKGTWSSAHHDDSSLLQSQEYTKLVLYFANKFKIKK